MLRKDSPVYLDGNTADGFPAGDSTAHLDEHADAVKVALFTVKEIHDEILSSSICFHLLFVHFF